MTLQQHSTLEILNTFNDISVNEDWCFKNVRSTEQWTHGYHRYPAKFLPNLVKKLIEEYTDPNDIVADLFAGCGTTLVEALVHGRRAVGVDINPVAELIAKVKITPIEPEKLAKKWIVLEKRISTYNSKDHLVTWQHDRIDYWFEDHQKQQIAFLYKRISLIRDPELRNFFLVALSNILKNCSRWLQSSTKPQVDPNKKTADVFKSFRVQCKRMIKKNDEFYNKLLIDNNIKVSCQIRLEDARNTTIKSGSVNAVITSPPYVTSYEYADIHQLTGFWFDYFSSLPLFRRNFIGTFYSLSKSVDTSSQIGQGIVNALLEKDKRKAQEVANYFNDMEKVVKEMWRILVDGGHSCIVIGNTTFLNVRINSAEVFTEMLKKEGFEIVEIIKRSIPHKLIPTIRDEKTGKFTTLSSNKKQLVYPEEFIIIVNKP